MVDNAGPEDDRILFGMTVFVLGDRVVVLVILLINESNRYCGGRVEQSAIYYPSVADAEDDVTRGDNLCLSCAGRLRILTRSARKEKGTIA